MTTGCEVGIYSTDKEDIHIPGVFTGPFFRCATGIESVQIGYTLNKNNAPLFTRSDRNW